MNLEALTSRSMTQMQQLQQGQGQGLQRTKSFQSSYFSFETLLVLVCLAASLLILPLVLPPLSPPPLMFLLIPIGIMAVLMLLAFMPSDVRNIASSYL
ncbi:protein AUXIN-REGULATED GENE INVOLVED IN ORGAN SIZE-like [Iris pallida]|uniref:Protein AUXIN-REGULATED GENE INVOLVED IN ORGAN SIZE-like n=1 Tax=Iris pallida TaxID=29817 RepID=A0AAX6ENE1_IRIPA|nr:protein AUXIN-REGULATED GENE INVOLVED IN ORGAN SIZE-like [Iris pallida]KAJ6816417.1 protein AUXIN-REGULATED GENE INVOLVED IN ORGAN SIZE-like [Iris pallida]